MKTVGKSVFRLGITGGIGSGKTSVCRVFDVLKIPIFSADRVASEIMEKDSRIKNELNRIAGKDLYITGNLDRAALSAIIFNDSPALQRVNSLVHPAVFDSFSEWAGTQVSPYVIMEAAILFESGAAEYVDKIATVVAPVAERIERVIRRNKLSREQVLERMKNQMEDEKRVKLSDFIIYNAENDMIIPAILNIHTEILKLIKERT